jgi:hypothetical protein
MVPVPPLALGSIRAPCKVAGAMAFGSSSLGLSAISELARDPAGSEEHCVGSVI